MLCYYNTDETDLLHQLSQLSADLLVSTEGVVADAGCRIAIVGDVAQTFVEIHTRGVARSRHESAQTIASTTQHQIKL